MKYHPRISIITVVYNDLPNIEKTILSVINQTYSNIEYIIIDGGSNDGTTDVIKKYEKHLYYWCTEADKGIYNAMNKGVKKATGDWIAFINSGDYYYNNEVFDLIFSSDSIKEADVIYGNMILKYLFALFLSQPLELSLFNQLFPFSHPASLVKSSIIKKYQFNEEYKLAADYDFFYKLYCKKYKFIYLPIIISVFEAENGASSSNNLRTFREVSIINKQIEKKKWIVSYMLLYSKAKVRNVISKFIPHIYHQYMMRNLPKHKNIYLFNEENTIL